MTGFSVYLGKLGEMAKGMDDAADEITKVAGAANGPARIGENTLGFFGAQTNFPQKYGALCQNVATAATKTVESFNKAAKQFIELERTYARDEDTYARKFHVEADHIKPHIPDLD